MAEIGTFRAGGLEQQLFQDGDDAGLRDLAFCSEEMFEAGGHARFMGVFAEVGGS
jgi:hypothetical protein